MPGELISYTDFNGNTITFEYDVNGRLVKELPDGSSEVYIHTFRTNRD